MKTIDDLTKKQQCELAEVPFFAWGDLTNTLYYWELYFGDWTLSEFLQMLLAYIKIERETKKKEPLK